MPIAKAQRPVLRTCPSQAQSCSASVSQTSAAVLVDSPDALAKPAEEPIGEEHHRCEDEPIAAQPQVCERDLDRAFARAPRPAVDALWRLGGPSATASATLVSHESVTTAPVLRPSGKGARLRPTGQPSASGWDSGAADGRH